METTFMTIHNITPEANILYASESIFEILGYSPHEVTGRSCFDYFHPDEVPFARYIHNRGVQLDKAAVLHYARVRGRNGQWIGCECVFTIVHDVLVACTSIYKRDLRSERRALDAPTIRRLFASSPRDPRYHMLEQLSVKFKSPPTPTTREPRAALFLNRFDRMLPIMYATDAVSSILGLTTNEINGKSFYWCIQENCLHEAIKCVESAKANDSIAYLRFWYRDPRQLEEVDEPETEGSSDSDDGGVELDIHSRMDTDSPTHIEGDYNSSSEVPRLVHSDSSNSGSGADSANVFDAANFSHSSTSSLPSPEDERPPVIRGSQGLIDPPEPIEIEAVVSCTSDGLVVVLRRARPIMPSSRADAPQPFANGLFAAPWGANPIRPQPQAIGHHAFVPAHMQGLAAAQPSYVMPGGPPMDQFMSSIREVAVFAWSLTGINGNIASYAHGTPQGEAVPPEGFPVWEPDTDSGLESPENQAAQKWTQMGGVINEPWDGNQYPFQYPRHERAFQPRLTRTLPQPSRGEETPHPNEQGHPSAGGSEGGKYLWY